MTVLRRAHGHISRRTNLQHMPECIIKTLDVNKNVEESCLIYIKTLFSMGAMTTTSVYCLFFEGYETLDAMGPIEFLHRVPRYAYAVYLGSGRIRERAVHR